MEQKDFIVTPIVLIVVYALAYIIRGRVTDDVNRRYFIPGLTVRILGALAVGFIYQFYYEGGDTFAYHTHGSRLIWEAFMDNPLHGLELLLSAGRHSPETFSYSSQIWYFRDQQSFFVIRVAAILDLITFSSYSATAILFAVISFTGAWLMFEAFYSLYPGFHRWLAISCLFVPTVFFWGSGIFKDTLTLAALGLATFCIFKVVQERRLFVGSLLTVVISFWVIYSIKIYILLCFLPAVLLWINGKYLSGIRQVMVRILLIPVALILALILGYFAIETVAADDPRYNLDKLAETARVTAYDIGFWTGKDAGSGYSLGELDGSYGSMLRLAPQAVNVSLFRPYLWEVNNPLMLLAALESLALLGLTIFVIIRARGTIFRWLVQPEVLFCLAFSLIFAFSVGVSTYNFGTLSRYKIPLMPFYLVAIGLIYCYSKSERKSEELDMTE